MVSIILSRQHKSSAVIADKTPSLLFKDNENRAQRQMGNKVFKFGYAEAHPILFKDKTN